MAGVIKRHADTLWACDVFTAKVLTPRGMRHASVLAFIHVKSRRVITTKATFHPTRQWSADAAACLCEATEAAGLPRPTVLIRDNDSKFGEPFDEELAEQGIKPERLPIRAPLCNAHMERWIQSLRRKCLDHFIPVGLGHLEHLVSEYIENYHRKDRSREWGTGCWAMIGQQPGTTRPETTASSSAEPGWVGYSGTANADRRPETGRD